VWVVAAWRLRQTSVPSLRLPHLDEQAYFTAAELRAAADFSRFGELTWLGASLVQLAVLAVYARRGVAFARESAAGPLGTGLLLGMLGFALVFLSLALAIVMGLARKVGRLWWLPAAPIFVGLPVLLAFVSPWLLPTHRLGDPQLRAAAMRLEAREGVSHVPVVVQDVRDVTSLPNAEAMGIGPSRRIVPWDTLVESSHTRSGTSRAGTSGSRSAGVRSSRPATRRPRSR
jgi:STE24 endopeptidase